MLSYRGSLLGVAGISLLMSCSADNADDAETFTPSDNQLDAVVSVVVAPDALAGELERLAAWQCSKGISSRVVPLSEALAGGSGPDDAARLKSYLQSLWAGGSLRFVTLAGDVDVMPVRLVDTEVLNELDGVLESARVPSDLYFADLDGDWDPDGDGVYAELDDLADLLPDVALGRLPVETVDEAKAYVDKVLRYEKDPQGANQGHVLLGADYAGAGAYSTVAMEYYVARQIPADVPITKLYGDYEQHPGSEPLSAEGFIDALRAGQSITFMMGHGNESSLGPMDISAVMALDNVDRPSIFVTCECSGGHFDDESGDCAGEEFVKGGGGGVAYIGNTDLGIGYPSLSFTMKYLAKCLYDEERTGPAVLGACHQESLRTYSKAESLHASTHPDRWTQLEITLLGDPTVAVWTAPARTVSVAIDRHDRCDVAEVRVTDEQGAPVADAVATAYVAGAFLYAGVTDASGRATLVGEDCAFADAPIMVTGPNVRPVTP